MMSKFVKLVLYFQKAITCKIHFSTFFAHIFAEKDSNCVLVLKMASEVSSIIITGRNKGHRRVHMHNQCFLEIL